MNFEKIITHFLFYIKSSTKIVTFLAGLFFKFQECFSEFSEVSYNPMTYIILKIPTMC